MNAGDRAGQLAKEWSRAMHGPGVSDFVAVGNVPATDFVRDILDLDESGYFMAGESTKTNVPGVFAAGDCRKKTLRQIVTAAADGAVAAHGVEEYLS